MNTLKTNIQMLKDTWQVYKSNLSWLMLTAGLLAIMFITQIVSSILFLVLGIGSMFSNLGYFLGENFINTMENIENIDNIIMDFPLETLGGLLIAVVIMYIIMMLVGVYAQMGTHYMSLNFIKNSKVNIVDVFKGYKFLGRGILAMLLLLAFYLVTMIPIVIFALLSAFVNTGLLVVVIIAGVILMLYVLIMYAQTYYIICDEDLTLLEAMKKSRLLMKNVKLKYIGYNLILSLITIIPFLILLIPVGILTFVTPFLGSLLMLFINIIMMLVSPLISSYMLAARSLFYVNLKNKDQQTVEIIEATTFNNDGI